ncbi:MAG: hypothetical protein AB1668_01315 [Nanoarchaeota archaeon]
MNKKEESGKDGGLSTLLSNLSSKQLLKMLLKNLHEQQGLNLAELIRIYEDAKGEILVPLSIFSYKLEPAEALCKYLKENENLSYKEIARLISRKEKSIWATYQRAGKKRKQPFLKTEEKYLLPVSIFKDRSYSLLESAVLYLNKIHRLTNPQIARLLNKSANSIAVLMKRARDKGRE